MDEKVADFCLAILFGSLKQQIIEIEYLFWNSISITSHENINETSTTHRSAIVFGSFKREKREV